MATTGFRQVSLGTVFHSKVKNLPSGENEKEIVWQALLCFQLTFSIEWAVGPGVS